jgi:hypothetical protein
LLSFGEDVVARGKSEVKMQSYILDFFRLGKFNVIYMNWETVFSACGEGDIGQLSDIGWTYGLQLWGTASTSNIEILERFQSKTSRMITDAPWYVTNALLRRDLHIPSVKEEIQRPN